MSEPFTDERAEPTDGHVPQDGEGNVADDAESGLDTHPDHNLTYEQARQALGEVVQSLETGGISLGDSIALWERGERLANVCQRLLDGAQERLDAAVERTQHDDAG